MEVSRLRIEKYETKLKYLHPEHKLQEDRQRLADTEEKLHMLLHRKSRAVQTPVCSLYGTDERIIPTSETESGICIY